MTEEDDTPLLADLRVATIRRENDGVDEELSRLEDEVADLKDQVDDLETERDEEAERAEKAEKLLSKLRDAEREDQLNRIREANEAVDDGDEVDLSTLEEASVDQLETVADLLEQASETTEVSNKGTSPDLSQVDGGEPSFEDELAEVAEQWGLSRKYEQAKNDEFASPGDNFGDGKASSIPQTAQNLPDAGYSRGPNGDVPMEDIMDALKEGSD